MLSRLVPQRADNAYRGRREAPWLFGVVLLMNLLISVNSVLNARETAGTADGIALDSFSAAGAAAVVSLFALLGLWRLVFCVLCLVVLVRYRAMVPLVFGLLLLEHLGRRAVLYAMPIASNGPSAGSWVNLALFVTIVAGFALSLMHRKDLGTWVSGTT